MSPEQARGLDEIDHRADLWSLAVIAFECLTGRLPFESPALGDLFAKIIFEALPVPSQVDPACTPAFDRWWARAAARDPRDRFAGAKELADALGRALGVLATPRDDVTTLVSARSHEIVRPARMRPRTRRSKFLVAGAVVALAPLVVTLFSGAMDARSARGATRAQNTDRVTTSAAPASASLPPPAAHVTPVVVSGPPAPLSEPPAAPVVLRMATANRGGAERATLSRPTAAAPRQPAAATASPPDDVDFGI